MWFFSTLHDIHIKSSIFLLHRVKSLRYNFIILVFCCFSRAIFLLFFFVWLSLKKQLKKTCQVKLNMQNQTQWYKWDCGTPFSSVIVIILFTPYIKKKTFTNFLNETVRNGQKKNKNCFQFNTTVYSFSTSSIQYFVSIKKNIFMKICWQKISHQICCISYFYINYKLLA